MKGKFLILTLVPVLFLAGCKLFDSSTKDASATAGDAKMETASNLPAGVLAVWADGSTLLAEKELNEVLEMAIKEQPELQGMAPAFLPMLKQNLLNSLVQHKLIEKYVLDKKIDQLKEYKEKVAQILKAVVQKVNIDFFAKEFESAVTEKEKKDYYDANKDKFALVVRGGVKAAGVKFDSEVSAKAFFDKVAGKVAEFDKHVRADAKLTKAMQDFNYVNDDSKIDQLLKKEILAIAKAPHVALIKVDGKTFWVVKATDKKASQYRSYEELKDQLEGAVKQTKQGEALMKKLSELQQQYGVKVRENAFAPKEEPKGNETASAEGLETENETELVASDDSVQDAEKATRAA